LATDVGRKKGKGWEKNNVALLPVQNTFWQHFFFLEYS